MSEHEAGRDRAQHPTPPAPGAADLPSTPVAPGQPGPRSGLAAIDAPSFDAMAALGGWRGLAESVLPTLVFVVLLAARPGALGTALAASLAVCAVALVARLAARQSVVQALGGAAVALISAAWAWRSGSAAGFYLPGLLINVVWLALTLGSIVAGWPLIGVLMGLWRSAAATEADPAAAGPWSGWRTEPARRQERARYVRGTALLAAMFALRLLVELPLYLAGASGALGVARLALGVPLFTLTLWAVWLLVRPGRVEA